MKMTITVVAMTSLVVIGLVIARRGRSTAAVRVGGLYSTAKDEDGRFGIVKVLEADRSGVHVSIYQDRFPFRPTHVDETRLTFGTIHDFESPGIMHVPLSHAAFERWQPEFMQQSSVSPDDLDPIGEWRRARGGYWQ